MRKILAGLAAARTSSALVLVSGPHQFAGHVNAIRAFVPDQSRLTEARGDAGHFVHRGSTPWACHGSVTALGSCDVRHGPAAWLAFQMVTRHAPICSPANR